MPTLDDLPTLRSYPATLTGTDYIPVYQVAAGLGGSSKVRKMPLSTLLGTLLGVPLNAILGLSSTDVTTTAATGTPAVGTVTTRLVDIPTGVTTSTATLPAPSGALREIMFINGGSGSLTVSTTGSANVLRVAGSALGATATVTTGTLARFLSNGTNWYKVD